MPDWVEIVLRTLLAVVVLFFMTKLLGKRQVSQLSFFEYITGITIGNLAAYISLDMDSMVSRFNILRRLDRMLFRN